MNTDFIGIVPDLDKIQCTHCTHRGMIVTKTRKIDFPGGESCKKYPDGKPEGITIPPFNFNKGQIGEYEDYVKCEYFEKED